MKKRRIVWFCLMIIFSASSAYAAQVFNTLDGKPPIWVSHKGANLEADENTLRAFKLAKDEGMDMVEVDVRYTKDHALVIVHDPVVDNNTNGHGQVHDLTLAEIKALHSKHGDLVYTLEETLNFCRDNHIGVFLDTKENSVDALRQMMALVVKTGMTKNVIVGTWRTSQVKWVVKNNPGVAICVSWPLPWQFLQLKKMGVTWIGTFPKMANHASITRAHKYGLKMITLEMNDLPRIEKKIGYGLDAIQTDNPRLKVELQKSQKLPPDFAK
jgi:glycerophosphoryl diester phosphodiesterase